MTLPAGGYRRSIQPNAPGYTDVWHDGKADIGSADVITWGAATPPMAVALVGT